MPRGSLFETTHEGQDAPLASARRPSRTPGKPYSKGRTSPRINRKRSSAGCRPRKTRRKASAVSSRNGRLNSRGADVTEVFATPRNASTPRLDRSSHRPPRMIAPLFLSRPKVQSAMSPPGPKCEVPQRPRYRRDQTQWGDCPVGAYADHRARSRNDTGLQIKPRTLALGGWRSILLRSLSGCVLLCLLRLRRRGQDSRRESLRIL